MTYKTASKAIYIFALYPFNYIFNILRKITQGENMETPPEFQEEYEQDTESKSQRKLRKAKEKQALVKKAERKQKQILTLKKKLEKAAKEFDEIAEQL